MKTKKFKRLLEELRIACRGGQPYNLTFQPTRGMSAQEKAELQSALKEQFEIWRDTWVMPWLDQLEEIAIPAKRQEKKS